MFGEWTPNPRLEADAVKARRFSLWGFAARAAQPQRWAAGEAKVRPVTLASAFLCGWVGVLSSHAQAPRIEDLGLTPADVQPEPVSFHEAQDFEELRDSYGRRMDFLKRCQLTRPARDYMKAIDAEKFRMAADITLAWLQQCPVDAQVHLWAAGALEDLGEEEQADVHVKWFIGITDSVMSSGDGKTPETAYVTISTSEEYAVLMRLGLTPVRQALVEGAVPLDVITAKNDAGTEHTIYFNPHWHFVRLNAMVLERQ